MFEDVVKEMPAASDHLFTYRPLTLMSIQLKYADPGKRTTRREEVATLRMREDYL
jgi:hypothetical protein